jgi:hypothetical protein
MPRQRSTKAAQDIIDSAQAVLSLKLVVELAEPLARYMLGSYADEEWRDSPQVEALARVAALLEARGFEVPSANHPNLREGKDAPPQEQTLDNPSSIELGLRRQEPPHLLGSGPLIQSKFRL